MTATRRPRRHPRHRHPSPARPRQRADGHEGDRAGARPGAQHGAAHPAGAGRRGAGEGRRRQALQAGHSARSRWRAASLESADFPSAGAAAHRRPVAALSASPRSASSCPTSAHDRGGAVADPGAGAPACRRRQPLPDADQRHRPLRRRLQRHPPDEIEKRFRALRWNNAPTYETWRKEVEATRRQGFSIDRGNYIAGVTIVAVPVLDASGTIARTIAAVGICSQLDRPTAHRSRPRHAGRRPAQSVSRRPRHADRPAASAGARNRRAPAARTGGRSEQHRRDMHREADRHVGQREPAGHQEVAAVEALLEQLQAAPPVSRLASAMIASVAGPGIFSRSTREIMPIGSMIVDSPYHSHCR